MDLLQEEFPGAKSSLKALRTLVDLKKFAADEKAIEAFDSALDEMVDVYGFEIRFADIVTKLAPAAMYVYDSFNGCIAEMSGEPDDGALKDVIGSFWFHRYACMRGYRNFNIDLYHRTLLKEPSRKLDYLQLQSLRFANRETKDMIVTCTVGLLKYMPAGYVELHKDAAALLSALHVPKRPVGGNKNGAALTPEGSA